MPQTLERHLPASNHICPTRVAIENIESECIALFIGARQQHLAPKDPGVHQLRRDLARRRNRAFQTLLRIGFADLDEGEETTRVTAAIYRMAHAFEERAAAKALSIEETVKCGAQLRATETALTVDLLSGNASAKTELELDQTLAQEEELLEHEREALHERMYRSQRSA